MEQGVLVASDQGQEWLLEWWWKNYSRYNDYPIAVVDFGMSQEAADRFKKRGEVIPFCAQQEVGRAGYEEEVEHLRKYWFKKPHALTLSPFKKTLWLDNDCEVLGSLEPLFAYEGLALAEELEWIRSQDKKESREYKRNLSRARYNTGVIVYEKGHPVIQEWAIHSQDSCDQFLGDQDLLWHLIQQKQIKVNELPQEYNWRMAQGINIEALIIHWVGFWGKGVIQKLGGLSGCE